MIASPKSLLGLAAGLLALAAQPSHGATFTLYNTGVNVAGTGVLADGATDSHYTLVSSPAGPKAAIVYDSTQYPLVGLSGGAGPWVADSNSSKWITLQSGDAPAGDYDYKTTFDLTGFDATTAKITGTWASDNAGSILLNGANTGLTDPSQYSSLSSFTIGTGFKAGLNTLDFIVNNAPYSGPGPNPTGLRVDGLVGTASAVPEPSQAASLGIGAFGLAGLLLRARRQRAR